MRKLVTICLISGISIVSANAQSLFTYGSRSVSKNDFLRVYKKNSMKKPDMTDTALRSYLDLYGLFKMKVAEAEKQHLDTVDKIQKDLDTYRKNLAKSYLTDDQITQKLIKEAYERMKENLHVQHILLNCPPGTDTLVVYKKIDSIYKEIMAGHATFESMAKGYSNDDGTKDNGGDIGYMTAMQYVYPFENMAYATPAGKVSKPFRTQFGYHILKVTNRYPDRGQVKVAQILLLSPKSRGEEGLAIARKRADSAMAMLKGGASFGEVVKKYSDDRLSANDSGVLKPFGAGKMVPVFEDAAFALKKPGDVSEPIKTSYGYHIIKLISKTPLAPYDSIAQQLKHKVENDARAQAAKEHFFNKVKEKNGYKEFQDNITAISDAIVKSIPDTGKGKGIFKASDFSHMNKTVFAMAGKNYLQSDFAKYLETLTHGRVSGAKGAVIHDGFNAYVTNVVTDFEEHKLVEENPDFKNLMDEYRDGIMLFELMDRNVWSKATKDSVGLKAFYETRKGKYKWEPGFEGAVYTFKNKAALDTGLIMLADTKVTEEQVLKAINSQNNPDRVTVQRGRYEFSKFRDGSQEELTTNRKKVITMPNGTFKLVFVKEIFTTPGNKSLDEARGYVVAEYQDYLEKQWNDKMRHDYPMKVNDKTFKSMIGN